VRVVDAPTSEIERPADPRRLVALQAVHNFRDMGGYATDDGQVTRWGMIYRADGLYRLAGDDVEVIRALGLRTVIDLRSQQELDERGTFPHDSVAVDFHHLSVMDATWEHEGIAATMEAAEFLEWAYQDMLAKHADRFVETINKLARPGALPAVFHCAAGKDRTGIVAALLLSALGVPRPVVVHDYALTSEGMERMVRWAEAEDPSMVARLADAPKAFTSAAPEAMQRVLDAIDAEHGSIREFLALNGMKDTTLAAIAAEFLEPA
jgi:protein-tyrosine phosphatase